MRIANHLGAAVVALGIVLLTGTSAMADTGSATAAASADSNVPSLQETAENPGEVDSAPGDEVPADPDLAPPPHCQFGATQDVWSSIQKPWAVTHQHGYENFSGSAATFTKSVSWERTLDASASWTGEGGAEGNVLIVKLSGKAGYTLAASGKKTSAGSESVTATMAPNHVYIYYAGARNTSGTMTHYVCNSITMVPVGHGTARSFGSGREGAVQCGTAVDKSSLGYVVERDYC
jgi:hypothetical protein